MGEAPSPAPVSGLVTAFLLEDWRGHLHRTRPSVCHLSCGLHVPDSLLLPGGKSHFLGTGRSSERLSHWFEDTQGSKHEAGFELR